MSMEPIFERFAHQLRVQSKYLESLDLSLRADPSVVRGHASALQDIVRIAQLLDAISEALNSDDPEACCRSSHLEQVKLLALPKFQRLETD